MADVVKVIEINGRKFELKEPAGYEVDLFVSKYFDKDMQPKDIAEANVALIRMCFGLPEDEIKRLPNSVYRRLLDEAAGYFQSMNTLGDDVQKKQS